MAEAVYGRLWVELRKLADGSLGYQAAERYCEKNVAREFHVDGVSSDSWDAAKLAATAFVNSHNAEYHSRVGLMVTAFGNRDWDMKVHYVTVDDGSESVQVACGKSVHATSTMTIADARESGILDTRGSYRTCKKCWRSPAFKRAARSTSSDDH